MTGYAARSTDVNGAERSRIPTRRFPILLEIGGDVCYNELKILIFRRCFQCGS